MNHPVPKSRVMINPLQRAWIRSQQCCIAQATGIPQTYPTECCHVHTKRNAGDENNLVPMALDKHSEQHLTGIESFQKRYQVNLEYLARKYQAEWENFTA